MGHNPRQELALDLRVRLTGSMQAWSVHLLQLNAHDVA